jgi:hypothetical protein
MYSGDKMGFIIYLIVLALVLYVFSALASGAALVFAVVVVILMLTPPGKWIRRWHRRYSTITEFKISSVGFGEGAFGTRENARAAYNRYATLRQWIGDIGTWREDVEWAKRKLTELEP